MKRLLLAILVLSLAGCAPFANQIIDTIERDGASSLTVAEDVWTFSPGETPALGVILIAEGFDLALTENEWCYFVETTVVRCDLGTVAEAVSITLGGVDIIAAANYRRTGSNTVYTVFYRRE